MPDTLYYLTDLRDTTLEYARKWNLVALRMGLAYTNAFEHQQEVLTGIKKSIEEARKREEAMMSFTLSLLTGGIVGPIADRFVKKFTKGGPLSTIKDIGDKVVEDSLLTEWTGNAVKELAKLGDEKLRELGLDRIKSAAPKDAAFQPTSMSPLAYITSLQIGMESRADIMSDIARQFFRDLHDIPSDVAKAVTESQLSSSFFTGLPSRDLDQSDLQRSAELMLWIAWARVRDEEYWRTQQAILLYGSESWHWAPLLPELQRLGVPAKEISTGTWGYDGYHKTINMPAFIKWAKGQTAVSAVFKDLPTDVTGLTAVYKQFALPKGLPHS